MSQNVKLELKTCKIASQVSSRYGAEPAFAPRPKSAGTVQSRRESWELLLEEVPAHILSNLLEYTSHFKYNLYITKTVGLQLKNWNNFMALEFE